ncbi:MAG: UbiA family prenyltransferase [Candidatus Moranbacteria bacterium]|nr:UbiA family prenyltransferase [Candidatus Moranbacteria bacterium]
MKQFALRLITSIENAPLTLGLFLTTFTALIVARLTVENALGLFREQSFFFMYFEFTHTFFFFLCSLLILLPVVGYAGSIDFKKSANVLLFGFLIILTPPIIDTLIFGGGFWSFYEFDGLVGLFWRFLTLFGDTPDIGITYGVRIEVVLVTLALGLYTYLKSKRFTRSLTVMLLTYGSLFVLGTFPSWITFFALAFQKSLLAINANDVAALFLSPERVLGRDLTDFRSVLNYKMSLVYAVLVSFLSLLLLFKKYPVYFWALINNARLPQLVYHAGLLLLGVALAFYFGEGHIQPEFFHILSIGVLLIAVECAWLASVIVNDHYDTTIDSITNPNRPLIENTIPGDVYHIFGIILFIVSLLFAGIVNFGALLILLAYQALAWMYSAPPLRLKKYPGVATLLAATCGILVLVLGFVATAPTHTISTLPSAILWYLFLAYFLALPIKDFKDIAGDKKDHIYTIPVLLGADVAKQVIGSLTFLLFALSPLVLNMRALFIPALLCGSLVFFALQKGSDDESSFFAFRKLPAIILTLTLLYGIILTLFLF